MGARESILKCIKAERDGVEQNRELLRSCVMVFVNLGNELRKVELKLYKENFQKDLLKHTTEYYKVASESGYRLFRVRSTSCAQRRPLSRSLAGSIRFCTTPQRVTSCG